MFVVRGTCLSVKGCNNSFGNGHYVLSVLNYFMFPNSQSYPLEDFFTRI